MPLGRDCRATRRSATSKMAMSGGGAELGRVFVCNEQTYAPLLATETMGCILAGHRDVIAGEAIETMTYKVAWDRTRHRGLPATMWGPPAPRAPPMNLLPGARLRRQSRPGDRRRRQTAIEEENSLASSFRGRGNMSPRRAQRPELHGDRAWRGRPARRPVTPGLHRVWARKG